MDNPYIGRVVVLLAPIIAALSAAIVNWVQDLIGANLDGNELTALLTAAVIGAFGVVYKWLDNKGDQEVVQLTQVSATDPSAPLGYNKPPE